jgi:hypothetical protein
LIARIENGFCAGVGADSRKRRKPNSDAKFILQRRGSTKTRANSGRLFCGQFLKARIVADRIPDRVDLEAGNGNVCASLEKHVKRPKRLPGVSARDHSFRSASSNVIVRSILPGEFKKVNVPDGEDAPVKLKG